MLPRRPQGFAAPWPRLPNPMPSPPQPGLWPRPAPTPTPPRPPGPGRPLTLNPPSPPSCGPFRSAACRRRPPRTWASHRSISPIAAPIGRAFIWASVSAFNSDGSNGALPNSKWATSACGAVSTCAASNDGAPSPESHRNPRGAERNHRQNHEPHRVYRRAGQIPVAVVAAPTGDPRSQNADTPGRLPAASERPAAAAAGGRRIIVQGGRNRGHPTHPCKDETSGRGGGRDRRVHIIYCSLWEFAPQSQGEPANRGDR